MGLTTDFNVPPFFDDYDENDKFYRILYRPSMAVQARELTQQQSITQNQIERFGGHVFKDGSVVEGVPITYFPNVHYISVEDRFRFPNTVYSEITATQLNNTYLVTNSNTNVNAVRAVIKIAKNGVRTDPPNTNRFYFDYIYTGNTASNNVTTFAPGDTLYFYNNTQGKLANLVSNNLAYYCATLASNGTFTSNGFSYCIGAGEGIIFQKGFFVKVDPHTITVSDFNTTVTGRVIGFDTIESVVDENTDVDLVDNSLGYPNENAPGAHRLRLTPTLVSKLRTDITIANNFFAIVEFDGPEPTQQKEDPEYDRLQTALSRRTFEESGDYVVQPFQVETRVHESNTASFYYEMSTGVAYVRGNRIEKVGTTKVEVPRATTTKYALNQIATINYGNYVICDEVLGAFDFKNIKEVALYDTPQNAISTGSGVASAALGAVVGYANLAAVMFEEGTRGSSAAKYLVYLFNIRMNTGKSFSTDFKSIYSASGVYGNVKADLFLENDLAVLKESSAKKLLFHNGLKATKRLTSNTGVVDTTFIYTQTKTGMTLASTGLLTVTIDSPAAGGAERLDASATTTLTGASLDKYNVISTNNAFSANLTGTITFGSTSAVVNGSGTSFTSNFVAGSPIRIHANSTTQYVMTVASVTNAISLTLTGNPASANGTGATHQRYFPNGSILPISSIFINSNTQFTANLNFTLDSGAQSVYASYPIRRSQASAIPKVVRKTRYVKIDCTSNQSGIWNLGFADIHRIRNVFVGTTYDVTNTDRLHWFDLDNGQRDNFYDHGRLVIKPQYLSNITVSTRMTVVLDYFSANTTASVGFFSVESYPIDDANTANTNAIQTIDIPTYGGNDLRNYVDFRPVKANTAADATTIGAATISPAAANSNTFSVATLGQHLSIPDNNFEADFEYYVPRIDVITLNSSGNFGVNKGTPESTPRVPFVENDQCSIAECYVPAFPSATTRQIETYPTAEGTKLKLKTNRRYTMKNIGVLDERLKRVEYYTVLNALEQQARDLTIPDINGLNRFKNGVFADPFNSHNIGQVSDFEYKIAIDPVETVARPYFSKHDIDLIWNASNSVSVVQTGPVLTLPYSHELYVAQRFATNYRVVAESYWQWNAMMELYPSYDFFRDEERAPNINTSLDLAAPWEQFATSPFATVYGDWRTISASAVSSLASSTSRTAVGGRAGSLTVDSTTTTTTTTQQQTIDTLHVDTLTSQYDLGTYITDVSLQPYVREQIISFVANGVKPNTILHGFFDSVLVDSYIAPGEIVDSADSVFRGLQNKKVNPTGAYGATLRSGANGFVCGVFRIPASTFRTGDRTFELTNVDNLTTGAAAKITVAKALFTADNLQVTKQTSTLTVAQPLLSVSQRFVNAVSNAISTTANSTFIADPEPVFPPPPPAPDTPTGFSDFSSTGDGGGGGGDPLTESFRVENVPANVSGIFLSAVGVFFQQKDATLGCSILISEMKDGVPDTTRILGRGYAPSASIGVSATGATETIFVLSGLIYLLEGKEYAFTIQPDANSPEYVAWVGTTGEYDIVTRQQVYQNPFSGTMFVSANQRTWTAIQKEDVKFNLYRARFTSSTGQATFNNEDDEYLVVNGFTRANSSIIIQVGDTVLTVNGAIAVVNNTNVFANTLIANNTNNYPTGKIQYFNDADGFVWLDSSTGGYSTTNNAMLAIYRPVNPTNTAHINVASLIAYGTTSNVQNLIYHAVVPKFGVLQPSLTSIGYQFKGTNRSNVIDTEFTTIINDLEHEYNDVERHLMSKSTEESASIVKSSTFQLSLTSNSNFVSPVISLSKKASLFVQNMINDDLTNEHTRYGNAQSKYVSKRIVLDEGQDAEDLQLYLTAYRPYNANVHVYAKFWNSEDTEPFDDKVWTKLAYANSGDLIVSSTENRNDFIEYKFIVPTTNAVATGAFANTNSGLYNSVTGTVSIANNSTTITGTATLFTTELAAGSEIRVVAGDYFAIRTVVNIANSTSLTVNEALRAANSASLAFVYADNGNDGIVEYKNAAGSRMIGYKQLAIKIVLTSNNAVHVPRLNDARGICLQI